MKRLIGLLAVLLLATASPLFAQQDLPWPADDPDGWLLAFVDVETTGLLPGYHEMIDIGVVITDLDGNEIDRLYLRHQPEHPERASAEAVAVNAFDPEVWWEENALNSKTFVDSLIAFHKRVAGEKQVMMVALNSQFDTAFIDQLFRSQGHNWRELYLYFVLDIPSMAWSQGLRGLSGENLAKSLGVED